MNIDTPSSTPLRPLEVVSGVPYGIDPAVTEPPRAAGSDLVAGLEQAILPALRRPPCAVSFSGGRDSSAILAVATDLARREGLTEPVPVSLRFLDAPLADEDAWQELVVRHLGISEWIRLPVGHELDLVGPVATAMFRRHGVVWPPNTHVHVPILSQVEGGSILTGIDGDGLFASWRWKRVGAILSRRQRPRPRDVLHVAYAFTPSPFRAVIDAQRSASLPWLTSEAMRSLARVWGRDRASEPRTWRRWVTWYAQRRAQQLVLSSFEAIARDAQVFAVHPFASEAFLGVIANAGATHGIGDRTEIMRQICRESQLLPSQVIARPTKARLDEAMWHQPSRDFIAAWDGEGVDERLVEPERLRSEWMRTRPHAATSILLQMAWCSHHRMTA